MASCSRSDNNTSQLQPQSDFPVEETLSSILEKTKLMVADLNESSFLNATTTHPQSVKMIQYCIKQIIQLSPGCVNNPNVNCLLGEIEAIIKIVKSTTKIQLENERHCFIQNLAAKSVNLDPENMIRIKKLVLTFSKEKLTEVLVSSSGGSTPLWVELLDFVLELSQNRKINKDETSSLLKSILEKLNQQELDIAVNEKGPLTLFWDKGYHDALPLLLVYDFNTNDFSSENLTDILNKLCQSNQNRSTAFLKIFKILVERQDLPFTFINTEKLSINTPVFDVLFRGTEDEMKFTFQKLNLNDKAAKYLKKTDELLRTIFKNTSLHSFFSLNNSYSTNQINTFDMLGIIERLEAILAKPLWSQFCWFAQFKSQISLALQQICDSIGIMHNEMSQFLEETTLRNDLESNSAIAQLSLISHTYHSNDLIVREAFNLLMLLKNPKKIGHLNFILNKRILKFNINCAIILFTMDKFVQQTPPLLAAVVDGKETTKNIYYMLQSIERAKAELNRNENNGSESNLKLINFYESIYSILNLTFYTSTLPTHEQSKLLIDLAKNATEQPLLIRTGFKLPKTSDLIPQIGHAIVITLEKNSNGTYKITAFNTGDGLGILHYPAKDRQFSYQTWYSIDQVPESDALNSNVLEQFIDHEEFDSPEMFYNLFQKWGGNGQPLPASSSFEDYEKIQFNGSCSAQCIMAFIRNYALKMVDGSAANRLGFYKHIKNRLFTHLVEPNLPVLDAGVRIEVEKKYKSVQFDTKLLEIADYSDRYEEATNFCDRVLEMIPESKTNLLIKTATLTPPKTMHEKFFALRTKLYFIGNNLSRGTEELSTLLMNNESPFLIEIMNYYSDYRKNANSYINEKLSEVYAEDSFTQFISTLNEIGKFSFETICKWLENQLATDSEFEGKLRSDPVGVDIFNFIQSTKSSNKA